MKKIRLKKIQLVNWKGQNRTLEFDDSQVVRICGRNGSGKTSIYKAFCWLLTGSTDADNVKNHELYDNRVEVSPETPPATVYAMLDIDGVEHEFTRSAKPKFESNGDGTYTRAASDTYTYNYNGIKLTKAKFDAVVSQLFNDSQYIEYMLMGARFANLSVDDRVKARSILSDMIGGINDATMGEKYPELASAMKGQDINMFIDLKKKRVKALFKEVEGINAQIATRKQLMDAMPKYDIVELTRQAAEYDAKIEQAKQRKEEDSETQDAILALREDYNRARTKYNKKYSDMAAQINVSIYQVDAYNKGLKDTYDQALIKRNLAQRELGLKEKELTLQENRRKDLLEDRDKAMALTFNSYKCPYCGQDLPEDELEKRMADFDRQKRETLQGIVATGKQTAARIEALKKEIEALKTSLATPLDEPKYKSKEELLQSLHKMGAEFVKFEETEEGKRFVDEIKKLEDSQSTSTEAILAKRMEEINKLANERFKIKDKIKDANMRMAYESQISELQNNVRSIMQDSCAEQRLLDMATTWQVEAFNAVEGKINSLIDGYKIVLYSKTRDGEMKPDCIVTTMDGVRYATMNNANRIKSTIALQDMFARYSDVSVPMFVDEVSIFDKNNTPKSDGQTILLYAGDCDLTIQQ